MQAKDTQTSPTQSMRLLSRVCAEERAWALRSFTWDFYFSFAPIYWPAGLEKLFNSLIFTFLSIQ